MFFFPLEQLCSLEEDELKQIINIRNIEIDGNKTLEENIFDWQIHKLTMKRWCNNFDNLYSYYKGSGYQDINEYLRKNNRNLPSNIYPLIGGKNLNVQILYCIYQLDKYISRDGLFGDSDTFFYRGIKPAELIVVKNCLKTSNIASRKIKKNEKCFISGIYDNAFISASKKIDKAANFVTHPEFNCCILRFRIPTDIKYLDKDYEEYGDFKDIEGESEIIIQRNIWFSDFKYYDLYKNIYIIDCEIELRGKNIDSFYNHNSFLDHIKNKNYYNNIDL